MDASDEGLSRIRWRRIGGRWLAVRGLGFKTMMSRSRDGRPRKMRRRERERSGIEESRVRVIEGGWGVAGDIRARVS